MKQQAGSYIKFSNDTEPELIEMQIKKMVIDTKQSFLKQGKKAIIRYIQQGLNGDDFMRDLYTVIARYYIIKIPRIANKLYKRKI